MSLSDSEILTELGKNIIIHPFEKSQLGSNSYDVTLGEYFYGHRAHNNKNDYVGTWKYKQYNTILDRHFISTQNGKQIAEYWLAILSAQKAELISNLKDAEFYGVNLNDQIIIIRPGELILAHTNEIVGTIDNYNAMIQGKSTCARIGISICGDSNFGNIGFVNRWTLEIQNHSEYSVVLIVGQKIGQILFNRSGPVLNSYAGLVD